MNRFSLRHALLRAWNSPTITTWASFGGRFLSVLLVLPLALRYLPPADIAVWQLFSNVVLLGAILDLGLSPTLSRVIALCLGGKSISAIGVPRYGEAPALVDQDARWSNVGSLLKAGRTILVALIAGAFLILGVGGSLALELPISQLADSRQGWAAWLVVLVTSSFGLWNSLYTSYLMGIDRVAILRRWEAVTAIIQVATAALVLALGGGLLELILANQAWAVFRVIRNGWLCRVIIPGRFTAGWQLEIPRPIWLATWPPMWRSGVGVLASQGVVYASGFIYAQWADSHELAAFLLAQRIMLTISQFSQAPFYSKLPTFARLYAAGNQPALLANAQRAMRMSYWVLVVGIAAVGAILPPAMTYIAANISFVSASFWAIYGLAMFVERLGAMHMQLFSLSNRILWHIANGLTGLVMLALMVGLYPRAGTMAFPIAMLVSYAAIYSFFSLKQSYSHFGLDLKFESRSSLVPALTMVVILVTLILWKNS